MPLGSIAVHSRAKLESAIRSENGLAVVNKVWSIAESEIPELSKLTSVSPQICVQVLKNDLQADLITRIIFSCLVDADWKDTGRYDRKVRGLPTEPLPAEFNGELWLARLLVTLDEKSKSCRETHVKQASRSRIPVLQFTRLNHFASSIRVATGFWILEDRVALTFAHKHATVVGQVPD